MSYEEHTDYDIIQSTNPEFHQAVVRINIHDERSDKTHRQTIQYLHPSDAHKLGQAELLVIDEAAAIPLPLVKDLLGPYLGKYEFVFIFHFRRNLSNFKCLNFTVKFLMYMTHCYFCYI